MKFDTPAGANPADSQAVLGRSHPRVDGRLKTTGTATYAAEHHDEIGPNLSYGYVLGAAIPENNTVPEDRTDPNGTEKAPRANVPQGSTSMSLWPLGVDSRFPSAVRH